MLKTKIQGYQNDWKNVKNKCRRTVNKEYTDNVPGHKFKQDLLISEHSPIRLLEIDWTWENLKYWASQELARHKWEKFITTQRTDRTGVNRDEIPQGAFVKMDGNANAQHAIDTARKRLCFAATKEAREAVEDLKLEIHKDEEEIADVMVPNCIYRCGCPEFDSCKFFEAFKKRHPEIDMTDIRARYKAYNEDFYELHKKD